MSEEESSALYQSAVYALVMALLVFTTVTLWVYVSVYPLLGLPIVYYMFRDEWDEYKRQRKKRKDSVKV